MNENQTIKTISILKLELAKIDSKKDIELEFEKSITSLINYSINSLLSCIKQKHIDINISGEYYDSHFYKVFEKLTTQDIIALSKEKENRLELLEKLLALDDPYSVVLEAIEKSALELDKHFIIDDTTIEINFNNDGNFFEYSCRSTSFHNMIDEISGQQIFLDTLLQE